MEYRVIEDLITVKESFLIVLDSRNGNIQNKPFNSEVIFDFEGSLSFDYNSYIELYFTVNSFSCPNSLYLINEQNNLLSITLNSVKTDYYITFGNYNINNFITCLTQILPNTFSFTYNTNNNIITMTNSTYDFTINSTSTIYEIMGFDKNTSYSSSNKILKLPYTSNFLGLKNLNIQLENVQTNNLDSYNKGQTDIIHSINIDNTKPVINYVRTNDLMIPLKINFVDNLHIKITDDQNNLLNFNNQYFNLTMQFTVLKDINRFKHSFQKIMDEN